jgi:hypothetical protein
MNDRIKAMWETAAQRDDLWTQARYEKFAELIVRECIDNVSVWENDSRNHISYMLKNHFGVEE